MTPDKHTIQTRSPEHGREDTIHDESNPEQNAVCHVRVNAGRVSLHDANLS